MKAVWRKYIDADDAHISICAADTIFSYFQDKMGMTHYLFFIGGNGSGKSNNLLVLNFLAYRNVMSTDMTAANIYQLLGNLDEGQYTLSEDEADNIDENPEKMRIHKNGYTAGYPVLRTDTTYGRKQFKFNTFCFKAFAAEKLPDIVRARGFNQRVVELYCTFGFPQYDISEIATPAGADEYQVLLDEIIDLRKTLIVFRMIHLNKKRQNIQLNLSNREKQLFKPVLRLFQNTRTFHELLPVVSGFISQKRSSSIDALAPQLYKIIRALIKQKDSFMLLTSDIWDELIQKLDAREVKGRGQTCDFGELGLLSQKDVVKMLKEVFRAEPGRAAGSGKKMLAFNQSILDKLGKNYDTDVKVSLTGQQEEESSIGINKYFDRESGSNLVNHVNHSEDRHPSSQQHDDKENANSRQESKENIGKSSSDDRNSTSGNSSNDPVDSINGSQGSQASNKNPYDSSSTNDETTPDQDEQKNRIAIIRMGQGYPCVYCYNFETKHREDYERHVIRKHPGYLACPTEEDLLQNGGRFKRAR